jgi:uncharacterized protein (TIGR03067 family)
VKVSYLTGFFRREEVLALYVGKWILCRAQIGTDRIEERLGSTILDLSLSHYVLTVGMKAESGRFTVNPNTDPPSMDLDAEEGPNCGRKLLGILEVSGDRLQFCYCFTEGMRPRTFFSGERWDIFCAEFLREGSIDSDRADRPKG